MRGMRALSTQPANQRSLREIVRPSIYSPAILFRSKRTLSEAASAEIGDAIIDGFPGMPKDANGMAKRRVIFASIGSWPGDGHVQAPDHHIIAREALFKGKRSNRPPAHATASKLRGRLKYRRSALMRPAFGNNPAARLTRGHKHHFDSRFIIPPVRHGAARVTPREYALN